MKYYVSSESVNCGHPDKTCDIIADSFLDAALSQDPNSQMAVECAIKDNFLFIYGEATTRADIDYKAIARKVLSEIGYDADSFEITEVISKQSVELNNCVVQEDLCANDQGIMYGYATDETQEYMPLPIIIAHKLMRAFEAYRKQNPGIFHADAKSQVTIEYEDGKPLRIDTVLMSVSHHYSLNSKEVEEHISKIIDTLLSTEYSKYYIDTKMIINPSGSFTIWGSFSDSGCVGRKIIVDTYGGVGRHGGGCFSSKNSTKVDRSGAYYARYVAKNIVAHGLAQKCEIQIAYAIGKKDPISVYIDCFNTNTCPIEKIYAFVNDNFSFRVGNIIKELDLNKPIYKQTACYGHFGRNEFSWEKIKDIQNI